MPPCGRCATARLSTLPPRLSCAIHSSSRDVAITPEDYCILRATCSPSMGFLHLEGYPALKSRRTISEIASSGDSRCQFDANSAFEVPPIRHFVSRSAPVFNALVLALTLCSVLNYVVCAQMFEQELEKNFAFSCIVDCRNDISAAEDHRPERDFPARLRFAFPPPFR